MQLVVWLLSLSYTECSIFFLMIFALLLIRAFEMKWSYQRIPYHLYIRWYRFCACRMAHPSVRRRNSLFFILEVAIFHSNAVSFPCIVGSCHIYRFFAWNFICYYHNFYCLYDMNAYVADNFCSGIEICCASFIFTKKKLAPKWRFICVQIVDGISFERCGSIRFYLLYWELLVTNFWQFV